MSADRCTGDCKGHPFLCVGHPKHCPCTDEPLGVALELAVERKRQITEECHSIAGDDAHHAAELARAAASFALLAAAAVATLPHDVRKSAAGVWPFAPKELREKRSARRMLVIAGALILAEIERLDRRQA